MFRFAREGLILMPAMETFEYKGEQYDILIRRAVDNVVALFHKCDITPCMFITDEAANIVNPAGVTWLQSISDKDYKFAKQYCTGIIDRKDNVKYPDLYLEANKKYPARKVTNVDDLLIDVNKRAAFVEKEIIKSMKVIFNIFTANKAAYNIKPKAGSNKILCNISNSTFSPTCFISDMEVNAAELLGFSDACRPVSEWRINE